jgi:hypothetical protein
MNSNFPESGEEATGPEIIVSGSNIKLTPEVRAVLRHMFITFGRIAIELEFGRGLSGSRVFKVHLTEQDGSHQLPAVVKVAPVGLIEQEWQAYKGWVKDRLLKIAQVHSPPVCPHNSSWAGLRYLLAGGSIFSVQSLRDFYQEVDVNEVCQVLENRLFKVMGDNWWWRNQVHNSFQMKTDYDVILPINLIIKPISGGQFDDAVLIQPGIGKLPLGLTRGARVKLKGLAIIKVSPSKPEVTLDLSHGSKGWPAESYRMRLIEVPDVTNYQVGNVIDTIFGEVVSTRQDLLHEQAQRALGKKINLSAKELTLSPGQNVSNSSTPASQSTRSLPNPLLTYQALLQGLITVKISTVHGDLNMENILVDTEAQDVELIDFATVHQGHAIGDLLRLETEVIIMLIPPILAEKKLSPQTIIPFYEQLHLSTLRLDQDISIELLSPALEKPFRILQTIRKAARKCLFNLDDWREYYQGLTLYLLGALKFESLDKLPVAPLPKQVAFWGAATSQQLLETLSSNQKHLPKQSSLKPNSRKKKSSSEAEELDIGTMPPESRMYIERAADNDCLDQLSKSRAVTLFIQAPWQMGKSSLMQRVLYQVNKNHRKASVFIDFQKFPKHYFEDQIELFKGLCLMIGDELGISGGIDQYWTGSQTNIVKCTRYLSDYIIPQLDEPLIIAMDEVQRMLTSPFRADFFGMLRTWHNDRVVDKNLARMSLLLCSSTDPFLLIDNPNQSPFNVARPVFLQDFTKAEVEELNRRHNSPLNPGQIEDFLDLIGGHPFLTRLALHLLVTGKYGLDGLLEQTIEDEGPFGQHLQHYWHRVLAEPQLKRALAHILRHRTHEEDQIFYRLKAAGLVKKVRQQIVLRNNLYTRYFEERLNARPG